MINNARIEELKEEVGEEDLAEVIELFCEEVEEVLEGLDRVTAGEMAAQLHFLKGSALNIGLEAVSELCKTEEARLKADPTQMPDITAIRSTYAASKDVLFQA
ncbi:MAG: Hpt domain-containing protein [Silicimonas sp.]|nr:Hpt domain-containing protein [Silicimonas sp.]